MIALGLKDLRVPPSQGLEWYHSIKSLQQQQQRRRSQQLDKESRSFDTDEAKTDVVIGDVKLLLYDQDDHAIDTVASEADHWINIKQWFDQYLL